MNYFHKMALHGNTSTLISPVLNFIKSRWLGFTLAVLALISVFSLLPLDKMPLAPGNDKFQHFLAYSFLALPAALRKPRRWVLLCIGFIAYSGIIELVQPMVNRCRDIFDLLTNAGGVACGAAVAAAVNFLLPPERP